MEEVLDDPVNGEEALRLTGRLGGLLMKIFAILTLLIFLAPVASTQEPPYKNLEVLPPDISKEMLNSIMLENLRGLGLRRRGNEGCLFCHVGNMETPRQEWDYVSDAKPMKEKGRVMLAMVDAINKKYLGSLNDRLDPSLKVSCMTCHAGRTDPRPLPGDE